MQLNAGRPAQAQHFCWSALLTARDTGHEETRIRGLQHHHATGLYQQHEGPSDKEDTAA